MNGSNTAAEIVEAICTNAWNWDLPTYCAKMGLDPKTEYARDSFLRFQLLAKRLAEFDTESLEVIAQK